MLLHLWSPQIHAKLQYVYLHECILSEIIHRYMFMFNAQLPVQAVVHKL